jgi:serine/threonine protein kinase
MSRNLYLTHYRLGEKGDVPPGALVETASATTFKAADTRTGAPVLLTLVPVGAVSDEQREKFEARAKAIVQFDHVHLARTVDFGREEDEYAFVSEYPRGETTEQWVAQYGRMPPEAVLRVAIQIVSVMGAAAFQQIIHGSIQPSNIVITPGQIAEGGARLGSFRLREFRQS